MTDTQGAAEESESTTESEIPAWIQEKLDAIRADIVAEEQKALAAAEAEVSKVNKHNSAKAVCTAQCGPIAQAIAAAKNPRERELLIQLENDTHEGHRQALETSYLEFSGQRAGDSNPATPGTVTPLESHMTVVGEGDSTAEVL